MNSLAQHASQMLRMEDTHPNPQSHQKNQNAINSSSSNVGMMYHNHNINPMATLHAGGAPLFLPHLTLNGAAAAAAATAGGIPTAQQLYMALLDIQMAAAAASASASATGHTPHHAHTHSHNTNNSNSTTTTTTTTTAAAILLPPGSVLSSQLAARLAAASAQHSPRKTSKRNINHGKGAARSSAAMLAAAASDRAAKRGKKTNGRVCAECHTDNTLQWRLGPDGQASLCNACGQRFQRRKQAQGHNNTARGASSSSPVTSSSPSSSPMLTISNHHPRHVKREPTSPPQPAVAERRSDIYSLLN